MTSSRMSTKDAALGIVEGHIDPITEVSIGGMPDDESLSVIEWLRVILGRDDKIRTEDRTSRERTEAIRLLRPLLHEKVVATVLSTYSASPDDPYSRSPWTVLQWIKFCLGRQADFAEQQAAHADDAPVIDLASRRPKPEPSDD